MGGLTHKRNNNRKSATRRVQRGGLGGLKGSGLAQKPLSPRQKLEQDKIDKMPDTGLGVLISVKSLKSTDQKIRGTPYVIIVPQIDGTTKYAYGSTADNAVKAAKNKQWGTIGREEGDTYTGTMISKKALISTNPKDTKEPYMLIIPSEKENGKMDKWSGSTPANAVAKAAQTTASAVIGQAGSYLKGLVTKKAPVAPAAAAATPVAPVAPAAAAGTASAAAPPAASATGGGGGYNNPAKGGWRLFPSRETRLPHELPPHAPRRHNAKPGKSTLKKKPVFAWNANSPLRNVPPPLEPFVDPTNSEVMHANAAARRGADKHAIDAHQAEVFKKQEMQRFISSSALAEDPAEAETTTLPLPLSPSRWAARKNQKLEEAEASSWERGWREKAARLRKVREAEAMNAPPTTEELRALFFAREYKTLLERFRAGDKSEEMDLKLRALFKVGFPFFTREEGNNGEPAANNISP